MKIWFEEPSTEKYTNYGCSPTLLENTIKWFEAEKENISSICVAMYLYNNPTFHQALCELAKSRCHITVYSIPLEGYDNDRKASVFDRDTGKLIGAFTKYDFAKGLYKSIQEMHLDNFEFRIVPHMYLRSK